MTDVAVLGAGPAGLAAALELAEAGARVRLIEQRPQVGGYAASFDVGGVHVDFGSHRLHPAAHPRVLQRIRGLLGEDLLTRPRHGRIRLLGRWIHFPLRPLDLLLRMHPRFALGTGLDLLRTVLPKSPGGDPETFSGILRNGLGKTICEGFYFPYARKIWGIEPEAIDAEQARKRVSTTSIGGMVRRLLPSPTASGGRSTRGMFYYPRHGFGQLSQAMLEAATAAGAEVRLETRVEHIRLNGPDCEVVTNRNGDRDSLNCRRVYSTIPIVSLARLLEPAMPSRVSRAVDSLQYRSMILVYLLLDQDRFSEFDAHYFPEAEFPFSRVSEPKNYTDLAKPEGRTVLCAELPCFTGDSVWQMEDEALGRLVRDGLDRAGLPVKRDPLAAQSRRIAFAYPLYRIGYERHFEVIDEWIDSFDSLLTFGRQGLFVHDNTHHAIYMAQAAAQCLGDDGTIDRQGWHAERAVFTTHVVED